MPASDSTRVNTQLEAAIKALLFDQPIAYHPAIAHAVGSVTAGVLLSQLLYWTPRATDPDGWVWKTQEQFHAETGLTRKEQESARRYLRDAEVLEERKAGVPAKLYFRINVERLTQLLAAVQDAQNGQTRMPKTGNQERPDGAHKSAQIVHAISEITTETTSEITNRDSSTSVDGNPSNSKARRRRNFEERGGERNSTSTPSQPDTSPAEVVRNSHHPGTAAAPTETADHETDLSQGRQQRAEEVLSSPTPPRRSALGLTRLGELLPSPVNDAVPSAAPSASGEPPPRRAETPQNRPKPGRGDQLTVLPENSPFLAAQAPQRPLPNAPAEVPLAPEQLAALTATIQTLSEKLGDERHWRSNLTQARRILGASGLNANAWTGLLWSVYHRTHEQQGHLRRPMAWFFTALREEVAQRSSLGTSLHASFTTNPPRKSLAGQYEHLVHR